jgi:hypothetical protein
VNHFWWTELEPVKVNDVDVGDHSALEGSPVFESDLAGGVATLALHQIFER